MALTTQDSKTVLVPSGGGEGGNHYVVDAVGTSYKLNHTSSLEFEDIQLTVSTAAAPMTPLSQQVSSSQKKKTSSCIAPFNSETCLRIEAGILVMVVVIVWALLTLPIVFFYLPVGPGWVSSLMLVTFTYICFKFTTENTNPVTVVTPTSTVDGSNDTQSGTVCSSVVAYQGTVCQTELQSLAQCLPASSQGSSTLIQSDQSDTVRPLLNGLELVASDECKAAALPFLCVHFFGLCDSTGRAYRPSSSQCTEISTGVCATEWALAGNLPGVTLPDCALFPDETILTPETCVNSSVESSSTIGLGSGTDQQETPTEQNGQQLSTQDSNQETLTCTVTCTKDFHCQEEANVSDVCVPTCDKYKENSDTTTLVTDILVIVCGIIGVMCGIAVLVISGVRRKELFVFPTSMVVYEVITYLIMAIIILVSFTDRAYLYCSSRELLESIANPTAYCTISGIVFYYALVQLALWWIFHVSVVFWKLRFPFHAHSFDKIKYVHILCVVLALLLPLAPIAATIGKSVADSKRQGVETTSVGFSLTRFPPIICTGTDIDVIFYALIVPLDLILFVGFPLLVMIFWIMHKNHVYKHKKASKLGTAERKILIVFCYYVVFSVFALSSFTIATRNTRSYYNLVTSYFLCERSGYDPDSPCDRSVLEDLSQPEIAAVSFFLLAVFPVANLIFVVSFRDTMRRVKLCLYKLHLTKRSTNHPLSLSNPSTLSEVVSKEQSF